MVYVWYRWTTDISASLVYLYPFVPSFEVDPVPFNFRKLLLKFKAVLRLLLFNACCKFRMHLETNPSDMFSLRNNWKFHAWSKPSSLKHFNISTPLLRFERRLIQILCDQMRTGNSAQCWKRWKLLFKTSRITSSCSNWGWLLSTAEYQEEVEVYSS